MGHYCHVVKMIQVAHTKSAAGKTNRAGSFWIFQFRFN